MQHQARATLIRGGSAESLERGIHCGVGLVLNWGGLLGPCHIPTNHSPLNVSGGLPPDPPPSNDSTFYHARD